MLVLCYILKDKVEAEAGVNWLTQYCLNKCNNIKEKQIQVKHKKYKF